MAQNYVQIRVKASDTAKPDLDSLRAQLDELGSKAESAKVEVDDADGRAKLLDMNAKLAAIGAKVANPKLSLSGAARVEAQLAAVDVGLDHLNDKGGETGTTMKGLASDVAELSTGLGAGSGAIGEMSMFQKVLLGLNVATGLGEPLIAGLTVAVGGLASGLTAAGAGLGIFGAVAEQTFSGLSTQISAATAAEEKMATAKTLKQQTADAKAFKAALSGLSEPQKQIVTATANAESGWHSFVQQAAGGVASVLVPALNLVPRALQLAKGFLAPVESALRGVVGMVSKGLNSQGFTSFVTMLQKNAGPMITKLAIAIKNVVVGIGGILTAFMPVAQKMGTGLDHITAKFAQWGQTLSSHSGFKSLMAMFKSETPLAMNALKQLGGIIKTVVSQMTGMSTFSNSKMLLQLAGPVLKFANALLKAHPQLVWLVLYLKLAADGGKKLHNAFTGISGAFSGIQKGVSAVSNLKKGMNDAEAAASDATGAWGTFGGKISSAVSAIKGWSIWSKIASAATKVWTGIQAAFDAVMDANPIVLIIIAIVALVAAIVILTIKFKAVREFWKAAWKDIEKVAVAAWHFIDGSLIKPLMSGISKLVDWIKSHWKLLATILATILLGPVGGLVAFIATHWQEFRHLTSRLIDDVVHFFETLPGRVMHAIASLPGLLLNAGKHMIEMLAHGIMSAIGDVTHAIGSIASEITSHLPFSPAKKGPLSGSGSPDVSGRKIPRMLAQGIRQGTPDISAAADRMAAAAGLTGRGALAGGTAGGTASGWTELRATGTAANWMALVKAIWPDLRLEVRQRGGGGVTSVQKALGQRAPAGA